MNVSELMQQVDRKTIMEAASKYLLEDLQHGESICSPGAAMQFLLHRLRHRDEEHFCCLFLDSKHRVLSFEELFNGTIDCATVYPRVVIKRALAVNAGAVILAHNHPSGSPEPSSSDKAITERLKKALDFIDVRLLDHMIIGDNVTSMAERGLI